MLGFLLLVAATSTSHLYGYPDDELDVETARTGRPSVAIPESKFEQPQKNTVVDGKVLIKRVELKGKSLFPKYGVNKQYLNRKLNTAYKKLEPWMSISDMHYLADTLTLAYQRKGLTFNQVFVVPSEIENNTLTLNVLTGSISEITIKNNKLYKSSQIRKYFTRLLGKVVYEPDIQQAMKEGNLLPGLKLFGFFSMGANPGQVRLNLHVVSETQHDYNLRFDNYGVNNTGVHRMMGHYVQNNVTGNSDSLQANLILTSEVGNIFGSLIYSRPLDSSSLFGASISTNQFEVNGEFEQLGLTGHLATVSTFHQKQLLRESNALADFSQALNFKHSEIRSNSGSDEINALLSQNSDYFTYRPSLKATVIWPSQTQKQTLTVASTVGMISKTNEENLDDLIFRLDVNYDHEYRWKKVPNQMVTYLNTRINYAPGNLPSSEKAVMTGPYGVRAYKPALFSADTVYSLSLEHTLKSMDPTDNLSMLPFVFLDGAYGEQNHGEQLSDSFFGAGFGVNFNFYKKLIGSVTVGVPFGSDADNRSDEDSVVVYGNMTLEF